MSPYLGGMMTSKKDRRRPQALSLSSIPESFTISSVSRQGALPAITDKFTGLTDHIPLGWRSSRTLQSCVQRWYIYLRD